MGASGTRSPQAGRSEGRRGVNDWKACERRIAKLLDGRRIPVTGRQRGGTPDIDHAALSIEVKSRKTLPAWLLKAVNQAQAASLDGKTPVVVLHKDRTPYAQALVVLKLEDFANHLKGGEK